MAKEAYSTNRNTKQEMGQIIDEIMQKAKTSRTSFERRWYDNNFFDDGFHFRMMSRTIGKIVDLTDKASLSNPLRAIPKASRQIRGVANLLVSPDYIPVVYPKKIDRTQFPGQVDPQTGEKQLDPAYKQALDQAKEEARRTGHWLHEEFKEQVFDEKLAFATILAGKHSISYLQVWPDAVNEKIETCVRDAFDVYVNGALTELEDNPSLIIASPMYISEIKANENFDKNQLEKISPDNKHASSEIKDAYMANRFGREVNPDSMASVILKEAYIKEYLNEDNVQRIMQQRDGGEILANKKNGDMVVRQVFVAGDIWLRDQYLNLPGYPLVDVRLEPGPLYGVPMIERFKDANKSIDVISSRVERYTNLMVTGSWIKRQGEQFNISNSSNGQIIEYQSTPPVQGAIAPIPPFVFNYLNFLGSLIEEQGVSTSTLGKIPTGVKANAAIESLKESEYANLVIASRRLKGAVKRVAEKMLDIADSTYVSPHSVDRLEKGEPDYFDVIGESAIEKRKEVHLDTPPGVVPLRRDAKIDIEVESGLAYTQEGKKQAANFIIDKMVALAQVQMINPEAVKVVVQKFLENYQFGATQEVMEAMEDLPMTEQQSQSMKVAIIEVMADLQKEGILPTSEQRVEESKVGAAEALVDTGVAGKKEEAVKPPSESISFKDLPPQGKIQMAAAAGIELTEDDVIAWESAQEELAHARQVEMAEKKGQQSKELLSMKAPKEPKGGTSANGKR